MAPHPYLHPSYLHPCLAASWLPSPPPEPAACGAGVDQLWLDYLCIGGSMTLAAFADVLTEPDPGPEGHAEHDMVVQSLNEHLLEHGYRFPVPYLRHTPDDHARR